MRVPLSWLKEYVPWEGTAEELADLLSMSGTEVENVVAVGAPGTAENLGLFRVGRVVHKERHPNADKLWLCRVAVAPGWEAAADAIDEGGGAVRQIVCGADNFEQGDTVAVALSGSVLQGGLKLRKAKLRGVASDGMILSEQELGFEEESPGIAVLPGDWPVGAPLADYLPVAETVLELEITPNRPDCLSVYGVAREVAAVAQLPLEPPVPEVAPTAGVPASDDIAVEVLDPDLCPRYGARVIRDVVHNESPFWLKARLTHAGMRPISSLVDVTNYAMLAVGEPLHAFDRDKIAGGRLIVRRAGAGEHIRTLDDVDRRLSDDMLVIADVEGPSAIAGVMGSERSEVDEATRHIVLEAATFSGPNIMRTSKALALRSEASNRFEKGLDREYVPQGLELACRLYHEICEGVVAPGMVDVAVPPPPPAPIRYRPARSDGLLGMAIPPGEQADILRRLGCAVEGGTPAAARAGETGAGEAERQRGGEDRQRSADGRPGTGDDRPTPAGVAMTVASPSWRADLEREVDLVEEVGRVYGLDRVPETLPLQREAVGGLTAAQKLRREARRSLAQTGLDEVVTYAFEAAGGVEALGLAPDDERLRRVHLANPMSAEQAVMRTTLLPQLLTAVRDNLARQNYPVAVFEQGRVYLRRPEGEEASADADAAPTSREAPADEREMLGIALCGPLRGEHWLAEPAPSTFYTLKGVVERLLRAIGVREAEYSPSPEPFLHPGKSADLLLDGRRAGYLGQVRPDVLRALGVEADEVYAAELSVEALTEAASRRVAFEDTVAYPAASQDLALVVDADVPAADVVGLIERSGGKLLRGAWVFDVYEGDQVPAGKRSLAVRLTMRAPDRTLSEKDVNGVRRKVVSALERELGATLR